MSYLLAYVAACVGLTVLIVWPEEGPTAWLRESALRKMLPAGLKDTLDCYICCSFWCSLLLSPLWWAHHCSFWCWSGCLITPGVFWFILHRNESDDSGTAGPC